MQGEYSIDLWLGDGQENLDVVEDALGFSIVQTDVYNSGIPTFDSLGRIILFHEWAVFSHASRDHLNDD